MVDSVVESAVGVTENCAALELIVTDPVGVAKSPALVLIDQYNSVPLGTFDVVI